MQDSNTSRDIPITQILAGGASEGGSGNISGAVIGAIVAAVCALVLVAILVGVYAQRMRKRKGSMRGMTTKSTLGGASSKQGTTMISNRSYLVRNGLPFLPLAVVMHCTCRHTMFYVGFRS